MKEKNKLKYSIWQNVCFMIKIAWEHRKSVLFICLLITLLDVGIKLLQLFITPQILSKVEQMSRWSELVSTIVLFSTGLFLLTSLKSYVQMNTMHGRIDIRSEIIRALDHKACSTSFPNTRDPDFLKMAKGAQAACSSNDSPTENIWVTLTNILTNLVGFIIYLMLLSGLNVMLITVVLITTILGFFITKYINEWGYRHREEKATYDNQMWYIHKKAQSITLAKDIRIFGLRPWLDSIYESALRLNMAFVLKREKIYIWANVVEMFLSFARNGIAYFYLIQLALTQRLSASEFLLYFTAVSGFTTWVTGILSGFSALHKESLGISHVQEYLNIPETFLFETGKSIPRSDTWELKLENVTFRYPGSDKDIIHNLTVTIHPGEKLAIVGLNGAGKTTLIKLICGFYDPDEGRILLNGADIRQFNRKEYYSLFSAVFQEFSMLDITIAETVAQTTENIDMARVTDCMEKAGLTDMVQKFPSGLNTHIGRTVYLDGVLLSGGQTQRLLLARALYKNGPILVLDEPTAALDPLAENDIYMKYSEMTSGKTSIFISHRLASTRFCDRIIFLSNGTIIEEGTHEKLLKINGEYAKLFEIQSRYYQEGREFDEKEL